MRKTNDEQEARRIAASVKANTTHGMSGTAIHSRWIDMKGRCLNPNDRRYRDYGGRGIGVCREWLSFENFLADMGKEFDPKLSLDRIDNDQGYSKENCRWATRKEQQRNRHVNVMITLDGKTQTAIEWSIELGINPSTIYKRINRGGWEPAKALTVPKRRSYRVQM